MQRRELLRRVPSSHKAPAYALTDLVTCGLCGGAMFAASSKCGPGYLYRCTGMQNTGRCPGVWRVRSAVEDAVLDALDEYAGRLKSAARRAARTPRRRASAPPVPSPLAAARAEAKEARPKGCHGWRRRSRRGCCQIRRSQARLRRCGHGESVPSRYWRFPTRLQVGRFRPGPRRSGRCVNSGPFCLRRRGARWSLSCSSGSWCTRTRPSKSSGGSRTGREAGLRPRGGGWGARSGVGPAAGAPTWPIGA